MHDRNALGPADVTDAELTTMVADLLGADAGVVEVVESQADEFPYDLPAITTAGRYWVSGTARVDGEPASFRMFVKHIQSWSRHPFFQFVPPEAREMATEGVPWRTEALAYASDLHDRLPEGLSMPRALGVFDLDELSNAVWLEEVPVVDREWDLARFGRAAYLLGRHAASPSVQELLPSVGHSNTIRLYADGRLSMQVLPVLHEEGVWHHPLVASAFDDEVRGRLLEAASHASEYVDELDAMPFLASHGDACPNNLLARPGPGDFVLIDYGFWGPGPVGFDLAQLLVGDVQVGRRSSDDLADVDEAILGHYLDGLRAEGCDIPEPVVRRAHALQLMVFTGLSSVPFDLFEAEQTAELQQVARQRADIARFSLDLLDSTS
ncbi:MAG: phosphotransferase [Marmoricola sp.]